MQIMQALKKLTIRAPNRESVAILVCLATSAVALFFLLRGSDSAWVALYLACVWKFVADWLGKRLWLLKLSIGGIYKEAKRGNLRLTGLPLWIDRASQILWFTAVGFFIARFFQ